MAAEHTEAVADARAHIAAKADPARPLSPLPEGFEATRKSLHVVAEQLLKPKREHETGNEIALRFTPGGFGTITWDRGVASGSSGSARVDGTELVLTEDGEERRAPAHDLEAGAQLLGVEEPGTGRVEIDADAAAALADWFAVGTVVLAELLERHRGGAPEPIRLWPEHFDVATVLGGDPGRANYGASPGDPDHDEPYLYVGPWGEVEGELWNGRGFPGAELLHSELVAEPNQLAAAASFLDERVGALTR